MPDATIDTADVIIGQRVCQPGATVRWQRLADAGRARLVFEVDDDLFTVSPYSKQAHAFFERPEIRANLTANIAVADLVTVTTEALAERLRPLNPNVVVLPNCVPASILDLPAVPERDRSVIGWAGSATHAIDWRGPDEDIARVISRRTDTALHLLGWCPPVAWNRIPNARRRFTPWQSSVPDLYAALDFNIGVIPLRDIPFNGGKSPIKLLELAARGIPTVAADVGPYAVAREQGAPALWVRSPGDWARHLGYLLDNPDARADLSARARAWAAGQTIEAQAHRWEDAYAALLSPTPTGA